MLDPTAVHSLTSLGLQLLFYVTLLIFTIFTVAVAYHWYSFGTRRSTATTALTVFLVGSAPLVALMLITLFAIV